MIALQLASFSFFNYPQIVTFQDLAPSVDSIWTCRLGSVVAAAGRLVCCRLRFEVFAHNQSSSGYYL